MVRRVQEALGCARLGRGTAAPTVSPFVGCRARSLALARGQHAGLAVVVSLFRLRPGDGLHDALDPRLLGACAALVVERSRGHAGARVEPPEEQPSPPCSTTSDGPTRSPG